MDNSIIISISTLLSGLVAKKLNFSLIESGIITSIISSLISYLLINKTKIVDYIYSYKNLNVYNLIYIFVSIFVLIIFFKYKSFIYSIFSRKKAKLLIYTPQQVSIFNDYFFDILKLKTPNMISGNIKLICEAYFNDFSHENSGRGILQNKAACVPAINEPIKFIDDKFNVSGIITWKEYIKKKNITMKDNTDEKTFISLYIEIIFNKKINTLEYLEFVENEVEKYNNDIARTYYYKVFNNKTIEPHVVKIYDGKKKEASALKKEFIDSFFHKEKDKIWNIVSCIINTPEKFTNIGQGAFVNYLLYGPPGSGKSSISYRLARALMCNIISLDISNIKKKQELYEIIQTPYKWITYAYGYDSSRSKNYIIVLEEFDICIEKILKREKDNEEFKKNILTNITTTKKNKKNKENDDNTTSITTNNLLDSDITVRDLLDILQGSMSINGSVIIAMTNRYEFIRDTCPELVRDGRLTPVYFDYLDKNSFIELCNYHFKNKPTNEQIKCLFEDKNIIKLPTSTIIKIITETKIIKDCSLNDFISILHNKIIS